MNLHVTHFSHVGHRRPDNEDSILVDLPRSLFVVADGMGGHVGGALASRLTVNTFEEAFPTAATNHPDRPEDALCVCIDDANHRVLETARKDRLYGMGTTVVAAVVENDYVAVAHVGDSRAYLLHHEGAPATQGSTRRLYQLTRDHVIGPDDTADPNEYGMLSAAVGTCEDVDKTVGRFGVTGPRVEATGNPPVPGPVVPGDVLLLCSDGLWAELDPAEIADLLSRENAAELLLELALRRGGKDNVSGIVVRVL